VQMEGAGPSDPLGRSGDQHRAAHDRPPISLSWSPELNNPKRTVPLSG
jgi:hypothetical protein